MKFTLQHTAPNSKARAGVIDTDHGKIETPIFMPVGTAAAMKGIFHRDLKDDARAQIILANTYHLYLRPGMKILGVFSVYRNILLDVCMGYSLK